MISGKWVTEVIKEMRDEYPAVLEGVGGASVGLMFGSMGYAIYDMTKWDWGTNDSSGSSDSSSESLSAGHILNSEEMKMVVLISAAACTAVALAPRMYRGTVNCIKNTCHSFTRKNASDEENKNIITYNASINYYSTGGPS
ncbi:MAG: hypothetical protein WC748_03780 [Legionellales bacterium]|jgi:hypothetical protein